MTLNFLSCGQGEPNDDDDDDERRPISSSNTSWANFIQPVDLKEKNHTHVHTRVRFFHRRALLLLLLFFLSLFKSLEGLCG